MPMPMTPRMGTGDRGRTLTVRPTINVKASMLRLANARANTILATMEIGQSSDDDDSEGSKDNDRVNDTNVSSSGPGHAPSDLQSEPLHSSICGCTC